ncbi:CynX/NimT family MFS transporter [Chloroflexota bacterium]
MGRTVISPTNGVTKYNWVMLSFSFGIAFLLHILLFATAPMVTPIMQEMDLSHAEFGFVFSIAMISLLVFRIPWGLLSDRIGYVRALRYALLMATAFAVVRAFSSGYPLLLLSQFFLGLGLAAILPCLALLVKEWSRSMPGLSTGIYVSGFAAGNATALGLTPVLLNSLDWRHVLLIYSGFAAIICVLWWCLAKSTVKGAFDYRQGNFIVFLKDRYVWVLIFFIIAAMGSYDTLATWIPKVLEMKALDKALASLLPLGFFLAGPVVGFASDKFRDRRSAVALLGAVAAASIVGINYAPFPLLLLCLFLSGFTTMGVLTISLTVPAEHERLSASAGGVSGLISSVGNIGPLVMPIIFGLLIDVTDTFQTSVLCVAILAGATFMLGSRVRQ